VNLVYVRYELLRTFRNTRFFILSLVFPVVLFLLVAGPNRHEQLDGISFPVYYMSGMIAWGTMAAIMAGGARIAFDRSIGWNRQIRLSPLPVRRYFEAKIVSSYVMATVSIALLYVAGSCIGVRLSATDWATMTVLVLIGLIPFAVGGIVLGHLLKADTMGPTMGGLIALLALLGGAWGPLATHGVLRVLTEGLPSYWLVQAGKSAITGNGWPVHAWLVIAAWTLTLAIIAAHVYRRDTARA
jgi:ABC-2 type transport system permease protein